MSEEKPVRITKTVTTKLRSDRRAALAMEIANHVEAYDSLEAEKKRVTKDLSRRLKEQRAAITEKSKAARTGLLDEQVECEERLDFDRNEVITIRLDTGEQVGSRPMTGAERQREIDFSVSGEDDGDSEDDEDDQDEDDDPPVVEPARDEPKVRAKREEGH